MSSSAALATLVLSLVPQPKNVESWTLMLESDGGKFLEFYKIAQPPTKPWHAEVRDGGAAGAVDNSKFDTNGVTWTLKVCPVEKRHSARIKAAADKVRRGRTPQQRVGDVLGELEGGGVVPVGTAARVCADIERYEDGEYVICESDPEDGGYAGIYCGWGTEKKGT